MASDSATIAKSVANDGDALMDLEQRVEALEVGAKYEATKEAVEKVEMEYLLKLREIRRVLILEQQNVLPGNAASSGSSSNVIESLQKENEFLKAKTVKLEYRIQHLVSNLEELYDRTRKPTE
jgi:predicted  nucleic acid-binding Zn-ribbon protein